MIAISDERKNCSNQIERESETVDKETEWVCERGKIKGFTLIFVIFIPPIGHSLTWHKGSTRLHRHHQLEGIKGRRRGLYNTIGLWSERSPNILLFYTLQNVSQKTSSSFEEERIFFQLIKKIVHTYQTTRHVLFRIIESLLLPWIYFCF